MLNEIDYWYDRFGRHLMPDASPGLALMGAYPHVNDKGKVRLGGPEPARFLISKAGVDAWSPVRPPDPLPEGVRMHLTSDRPRRAWVVDILLDPPPAPFLAASLGQSGADAANWQMTINRDRIVFGGSSAVLGGPSVLAIDRARFLEAMRWFQESGVDVRDLLRAADIRHQHRIGLLTGAAARARLGKIKADPAVAAKYPGEANSDVMRLASFAASKYYQRKTEDA
jgi:hypothetical protein